MRLKTERGWFLVRLLRASSAIHMGTSALGIVQALWRGRPRFVDEWPWLVGSLAVGVALFVLSGRLMHGSRPREAQAPAEEPSMELARRLAGSGKRIQAVKVVRDLTGVSFPEAVAVVDSMAEGLTPPRPD